MKQLFRRSFLMMAVNAAGAAVARTLSVAVNARAVNEGDDWFQISPYGEFPTNDGKFLQVFGKAEATQMVAEFNSVVDQALHGFRGVPVFYGHPKQMPQLFKDPRRIGKIMKVEAREDGLYGKVIWNALGKENMKEGYMVYPSPGWMHPKPGTPAEKRVHPIYLDHVGMVNDPNIDSAAPWTNSQDDAQQQQTQELDPKMKEKLCALFGLDPATATDDEILAKVTALKGEADKATKLNTDLTAKTAVADELEKKKKEMEDAVTAANSTATQHLKTAAGVALDVAVNAGQITAVQRPEWETKLIANGGKDFATQREALGKLEPKLNTKHLDIGGRRIDVSDQQGRQIAVNTAVDELRDKNKNLSYTDAYNQVRRDPRFKAIFEAMKKPGQAA